MIVVCSKLISKPTTFLARQGHESEVTSADSSWQKTFDETDGKFLEPYPPTQTNFMAKFLIYNYKSFILKKKNTPEVLTY
jgi:hypothetical protein